MKRTPRFNWELALYFLFLGFAYFEPSWLIRLIYGTIASFTVATVQHLEALKYEKQGYTYEDDD